MRLRIAGLLALLWAGTEAHDLVLLGGPPSRHVVGWLLCLIALLIAASLLTSLKWARVVALVAGLCMLSIYGWFCLRYGVPHMSAWLQPVLDVALVATLIAPPSNSTAHAVARDAPPTANASGARAGGRER